MINVSDTYKDLIKQPVRYVSIYGAVLLNSGELVYFTDKNLISGSLSITQKLNRSGDFRPGGVYSSELSIGFTGLFARTNDLDGAAIKLSFLIYPNSDMNPQEAENVPLGKFYVDGSTIKRSGSAIRLKANDGLMLFDIEATARSGTLYELVTGSCDAAGLSFGMTQEQFEALPNATISAAINTSRIQTERDLLMFVASATGSFARMSRTGMELDFIPLTCETDETTGAVIPAREILGNIRFSTDFSDDKTRISKVFMRRNGKALYSTLKAIGNQKLAHLELEENPLMAGLSDSEVKSALNDILRQIYVCVNRVFNAEFNGDPSLDVGDYVKLRGGTVDVDRGYACGMITSQVWRYHGQHTIKCTLPASLVYVADSTSRSASTTTPPERSVTKSQLEKRVDNIESGISDGVGKSETAENLKSSDTDCRVYTHSAGIGVQSASGDHLGGLYLGEGNGLTLTSVKGYPIIKLQSSLASVEINIDYISIRSTKATIYADGDVFSIDNGKQRLEAKTDSDGTQSLYFNGKKVLTE